MPISHEIFRISKKETYHIHHETKLYNIYENKANPWFWPKFFTCLHRKVRWVQAEIGPFPVKVHRLLDPVYTIGARLAVRVLGRCQLQPRFRPIKIRARAKGTPLPLYWLLHGRSEGYGAVDTGSHHLMLEREVVLPWREFLDWRCEHWMGLPLPGVIEISAYSGMGRSAVALGSENLVPVLTMSYYVRTIVLRGLHRRLPWLGRMEVVA